MQATQPARSFLLLQGPTNHLFAEIARQLRGLGHAVHRVHVCLGDEIFWRGPGGVRFTGRAAEWPAFVARLYEEHRITDLLLLGEKREFHRQAIELAQQRAIEVAVTDFGYLRPDWVILERDGMNGDSRFPRDIESICRLAQALPPIEPGPTYRHSLFTQALWDMCFHLSSELIRWPYLHYRSYALQPALLTYLTTGWRLLRARRWREQPARLLSQLATTAPMYLFAMQMEVDFSLRAYSHYPDLDTAMAETIASFARHAVADAQLVFKVHPLDSGEKAWSRRIAAMAAAQGVGPRVHFIDGGDLDAWLRRSSGLITVNSTVGLRALELDRPVLALGQAIYRVAGLVFGGPLDAFWQQARSAQPAMVDAFLRLLAASLHVRGGMYDKAAIQAAADGMVYRLHHRCVNQPLPAVLQAQPLHVQAQPLSA